MSSFLPYCLVHDVAMKASDWPSSSSKHFASMSEFQQQKRAQPEEGDSQNFFAGGSEHR